jgi:hypothetical protein
MRTIFLSVQTGMVARDLLRCGPLEHILRHPEARVVLLTPGSRDPAFVDEFSTTRDRVAVVPLEPYAPTPMVWRLMTRRWRHARTPAMADTFHRLEQRLIPTPPAYTRLFDQYAPALVVSGDPLRPGDANLIATARRRGIPTLGSVRSWDNVLKHLRTRPDALTVWNAINAREAVAIDRFRPHQVTQVGAPQLDVYFSDCHSAITREALGLDPAKKTLLLATSSFTYDSDQTYLVDMLLAAIRNGDIRHPLQIVLRLHPDDKVGRYLKYRHAPEIILDIPERYLATLGWTMTHPDLERMAALVRHADVMVNFATTVTLEAAIVDTPTLLVAFSPIDPDEMQRYVVGLHFGMHYKRLVERDLVPVAWDRDQLVSWVNRYLDDPSLYRTQRAAIAAEWVQFTDGASGQRLGEAILRQAGLDLPSQAAAGERESQCALR